MSRLTALVVCAAVTFLGGAQASADAVKITGGTLLVTGRVELARIALAGTQGFSLDAIADPSEGRVDPVSQCPCVPGTSISLGGNLSGAFEGLVTFDGNTFPLVISTAAETILFFEWDGVTTAPPPGNGPVSLTEHFAMTGRLLNQGVKLTDIIGGGGHVVLGPARLRLGIRVGSQQGSIRLRKRSYARTGNDDAPGHGSSRGWPSPTHPQSSGLRNQTALRL